MARTSATDRPYRLLHLGRGRGDGTNGRKPGRSTFLTKVRWAAPQAIGQASALGYLHGKAISGDNGATRIGYPAIGLRSKYQGYGFPGQLFLGYTAGRVAGGAVRVNPGGLPATAGAQGQLASPLAQAMRTVTIGQIKGNA